MPVFTYRARTLAGGAERGLVDAESLRGAWQALRARGIFPTELHAGDRIGSGRTPTAAERAAMLRDLATLLRAGVPIVDALADVAAATSAVAVRRALTVVRARVREGERIADALAVCPAVFPPLDRELVRAGDESGTLAAVLERLATAGQAAAARTARVRRALLYPAVMMTATAAVLVFLLLWVVPQVTRLFAESGAPLPVATRVVIGGAAALRATWWLWAIVAVAGAVGLRQALGAPATRRRLDTLLLRVPLAGDLACTLATARIARVLATVLPNGVPLIRGLELAAATAGNVPLADATLAAREAVRRGEALAPAIAAAGVFPALLPRLIATGERSGRLGEAFAHAAEACEARGDDRLEVIVAAIEPALVLLMGGVVLAVVLAILVPLLTLDPVGATA